MCVNVYVLKKARFPCEFCEAPMCVRLKRWVYVYVDEVSCASKVCICA